MLPLAILSWFMVGDRQDLKSVGNNKLDRLNRAERSPSTKILWKIGQIFNRLQQEGFRLFAVLKLNLSVDTFALYFRSGIPDRN